jgi:hypothetical protein
VSAARQLAERGLDVLHEVRDQGERQAHFHANLDDLPYAPGCGASSSRSPVTVAPA